MTCDVFAAGSFAALLDVLAAELLAAMAHQDAPPARLHRLAATAGAAAPFDAAVVVEDQGEPPFVLEPTDAGAGKFTLMFTFSRFSSQGIALLLEYDANRFRPQRIQRLAEHLERLIQDAADRSDAPVAALRLLSDDEAERLSAFNRTDRPYPRDASLAALFRDAAARHAGRIALVGADGETLTYAELDRRSDAMAAGLAKAGVGAGETVALAMERGPAAIVAILAILKAGGVYMPLDRGFPAALVRRLMDDAGATRIVADAAGRERLAGLDAAFLAADAAATPPMRCSPPAPPASRRGWRCRTAPSPDWRSTPISSPSARTTRWPRARPSASTHRPWKSGRSCSPGRGWSSSTTRRCSTPPPWNAPCPRGGSPRCG